MRILIAAVAVFLMTASAAGQTTDPQNFSGALAAGGAGVSFDLDLQAGQVVTLTTTSARNVDTILTLNGPNGRRVAQNDDELPGVLQSRIVYVARASGRHTAVVTGYGGAVGAFELHVAHGLNAGLSDASRVLREETGSFDSRHGELRFPVDLSAGDILVATTAALTDELDTTLALVDASGAILTQNDDMAEGNLNSQLAFQAPAAGRYELVASTYGGRGRGDFVISLALDPNANAPFNFASVDGDRIAQHEGTISDAQLTQEFRVTLAAGQTVLATADVTSGNLDPVLKLKDPEGNPLAINDDRGDGSLNSAVAFTATAAGEYIVELSRYRGSSTTGNFRVVVSSVEASVVDALQDMVENQGRLSGPEQILQTADFTLHYTLEGSDAATPEYVQQVGDTLQRMLEAQTRMGWALPARYRDGRYRVNISAVRGAMGYTKPVQVVFDNPNTPNVRETASTRGVLMIDNDYEGMGKKASPISLMHATATHELNHLFQYGYDGEEGLQWLYEATASWMEVATAGADQDATDYVATDFAAPELCWTTTAQGHDYAQWTLLQSLADSYGEGVVVRLWENSVQYDGFETMSQTLAGVGTTIPDALQRWRVQNFARAYAVASKFTRTVRLNGAISRNGSWSPRGRVQELGAHYVAVRLQGAHTYTLRGGDNLELVGLGRRNGEIEVIPLGRGGVFNASGYDYAALMVFNRAVPSEPGECRDTNYSIVVADGAGAMASPQYRFNAEHFAPPS